MISIPGGHMGEGDKGHTQVCVYRNALAHMPYSPYRQEVKIKINAWITSSWWKQELVLLTRLTQRHLWQTNQSLWLILPVLHSLFRVSK